MRKILINKDNIFVAELDVVPEQLALGYRVVEVSDDSLLLHDRLQYSNGIWQEYDPRSLANYKTSQWEQIKTSRDLEINAGFDWNNHTFDSDSTSRANIQGAVSAALLSEQTNQPFNITWTLKDNTTIDLNSEKVKQIGLALANHLNNSYEKGRTLRDQIDSATTKEEVLSIRWSNPPILPPGIPPGQVFKG